MRITESTLRKIVREEIVNANIKRGRMSLREGRRVLREGNFMTGEDIVAALAKVDKDQAERIKNNVHIRKNPNTNMEVTRQGNGDIAFYTADGKNMIESIPKEVAKKAGIEA